VETGGTRAAASVEGAYKDVFALQRELASKLAKEVRATLPPALPLNNVAALQAFSDGLYFYRNDLLSEALTQFDRALALEPNYVNAQFYKGLAMEKLGRWDDAIAAFTRALPRPQPERRVVWSWDAPFTAERSKRGGIAGVDVSELSFQRYVLNSDGMKVRRSASFMASAAVRTPFSTSSIWRREV
jgi:tetratricopeptide (TPR) repeat protein